MLNVKYNRDSNETLVELEKLVVFDESELPLIVEFRRAIDGKPDWIAKLNVGSWVKWQGGSIPYDVYVNKANGESYYLWKYDIDKVGRYIEKTFYHYIKHSDKRTNGLIIGSHDGLFGHWVFPVFYDKCNVVIVEGSEKQFKEVKYNYEHLSNKIFVNEIITPDGKDVEWLEGGEGFTDTVCRPVISKFLKDDEITSSTRPSTSINDLIKRYGGYFDWIHFDVEGLDADLIMALTIEPELMIFESSHLSNNKYMELLTWLQDRNYKLLNDGTDCVAIKIRNKK